MRTHTYVTMEVSSSVYEEVLKKLIDAGYQYVIGENGELDMHGIALLKEPEGKDAQ